MALWEKAPAAARQGLDFRKAPASHAGYLAEVSNELFRNLGLFTIIVLIGLQFLPEVRSAYTQTLPQMSSDEIKPVTIAAIN
ncbi:hypothetical protein [Shimia sp. SK013]|uniref:hypothetical protein n=1 Tax=Shimia sp. SK013 TaxID=1389006 RepID=UPI00128F206F|nr:hypothetical protein [Shimia sp. SK013]